MSNVPAVSQANATSSNEDVLTASAGAAFGLGQFPVDLAGNRVPGGFPVETDRWG